MRVLRHPHPAAPAAALAGGSFDGVHRGHQAIFARTRAAAAGRGIASGAFTFEPLPREFFAPRAAPPRLTTLAERIAAMAPSGLDLAYVQRFDARFAALTAQEFAERLARGHGARWVIVGEDFRYGARRGGDPDRLRADGRRLGFEVEVLAAVHEGEERISSTRVRELLAAGDLAHAERLLGRPYSMCGRVIHGAKRGRAMGYPTANVRLGRGRPALQGIYAVKCFGAATRGLEGVASLGTNPAVRHGGPATLEAFLFDFSGDLYGRRLTVEFLKKLRDEAHFASMEALAAQIRRDCDDARRFFAAVPR